MGVGGLASEQDRSGMGTLDRTTRCHGPRCRESGEIVGIGMLDGRGEVLLNYVRPDRRFRGVSTAVLAALEGVARTRGAASCFLESTETARRFYQCRGYTAATGARLQLEKRL
ncbi:MAG TPA: GNAT family N-acetyltransferase [Roseovarius sp.]|nr:GNAT family N-acetyltransferase [Roseovarius sp.]